KLFEKLGEHRRIGASYQILCQHAGGIREFVVGTGLDRIHRGTGVEIMQPGTGQRFAILSIHAEGTLLRNKKVKQAGGTEATLLVLRSALGDRYNLALLHAVVLGARTDNPIVRTLLEYVAAPAGHAR